MKKTYVDDSRFMGFIDELATQITEMNFGADTTKEIQDGLSDGIAIVFTDEAQDFYNEKYDEYETMINKMIGVYKHHDMIMHIYPNKTK